MKIFKYFKTNYFKIFYYINKYNTISDLSKNLNISINTVIDLTNVIELDSLIYKRKEGRKKVLYYTPKGIEIYNSLKEFITIFNTLENSKEFSVPRKL